MKLKRIMWKRAPTMEDIQYIRLATTFGPSVFQRGLEWVFIHSNVPMCHADAPDGFELVNGWSP
jgi:hypothetical protein